MNLLELEELAKLSIGGRWGLGDPFLYNSESAPPYYRFLYHVVQKYKPSVVIECGVYMATATVHIAIGNRDTLVIGIDKNPHERAYSAQALYDNVKLVLGDTTDISTYDTVVDLCGKNKVGLLFIDSEHDGKTPLMEFLMYKRLFADVCLVALDDVLFPAMQDFWKNFPGEKANLHYLHPAQYPGMIDSGFGISIIRKELDSA